MNNVDRLYTHVVFRKEIAGLLSVVKKCTSIDAARELLIQKVMLTYHNISSVDSNDWSHTLLRSRDCAQAFINVFQGRSERIVAFSVVKVILDVASGKTRNDLTPAFYAEMINWIRGLEGRSTFEYLSNSGLDNEQNGRLAALQRSDALDELGRKMEEYMQRYTDGLRPEVIRIRGERKERIIKYFGGSEEDWYDWRWQTKHLITQPEALSQFVALRENEYEAIDLAYRNQIPFAITPHYVSLIDADKGSLKDMALRAQVIPSHEYVQTMIGFKHNRRKACDFMLESDTSPIDLIVRRYPNIVILKPCNTCPQICVYCQRNWEIEQAMSHTAIASREAIRNAVDWIAQHPMVHEVLITGGDPLILDDKRLDELLGQLLAIPHIHCIRIGTRTLVTLPMRINRKLTDMLKKYSRIAKQRIAIVTHIESAYEITPEMVDTVCALRQIGINVYNQHVYTFYVSRRFENAFLRLQLRRIGIDPYYTFVTKGKDEISNYWVPLARLLQEQKEEARLIPGLSRTDETVFNIPGLGKNYIRAKQHRDLLSVLPDGSRVYEFHPWEKNITPCKTYVSKDIPIYDYLGRLCEIGENPLDYGSIWYYF